MAAARRLNQFFLLVVLCFSLMSCSVIRPALITDAKERICKRSRGIKDVEVAKIAHHAQQSVIEGCNWEFDNNGRVFLELQTRIAAEGDYDIALDFHEPFADFLFHSSLGFLAAGGKENIRIGPLPYEFSRPSFAEVSLLLLKEDARGKAVLVDEAALSGFDTGGLTAQALLDKYASLLKTDIVTNSKTRVVFFDLPPKTLPLFFPGRRRMEAMNRQ